MSEGGWGRTELHNWWRSMKREACRWPLWFLLGVGVPSKWCCLLLRKHLPLSHHMGFQHFFIQQVCHLLWEAFLAFNYSISSHAIMLLFLFYLYYKHIYQHVPLFPEHSIMSGVIFVSTSAFFHHSLLA